MKNGSNLPDLLKIKFRLSFYKLQYFISAVILGIVVLYGESIVLNTSSYAEKMATIPVKFRIYYIYEFCFLRG